MQIMICRISKVGRTDFPFPSLSFSQFPYKTSLAVCRSISLTHNPYPRYTRLIIPCHTRSFSYHPVFECAIDVKMGHSFHVGDDALTKGIQQQYAVLPASTPSKASNARESFIPRDSRFSNSREKSDEIKKLLESEPPTPSHTHKTKSHAYKRHSLDGLFRSGYFSKKSRHRHQSRQKSSKQDLMRNVVRQETAHGSIYYKIQRGPEDLGSSDNLSAFRINFPTEEAMKSISSKDESHPEEIRIQQPNIEKCQVETPHTKENATGDNFEKSALAHVAPTFLQSSGNNAVDIFGIANEYPHLLPGNTTQSSAQHGITDSNLDIDGFPISVSRHYVEPDIRGLATQNTTRLINPTTSDVSREIETTFERASEGMVANSSIAKLSSTPKKSLHPLALNEISKKAASRKPINIPTELRSLSDTVLQHPTSETSSTIMHSSLPRGYQLQSSSDSNSRPTHTAKVPPCETSFDPTMDIQNAQNTYLTTPSSPGPAPTTPLPLPPMNRNDQSTLLENESLHALRYWKSAATSTQRPQVSSPPSSPVRKYGNGTNGVVSPNRTPLPSSNTLHGINSPYPQSSLSTLEGNGVIEKTTLSPKLNSSSEWSVKRIQSRKALKKIDIERARAEKEYAAKAKTKTQADYDAEDDTIDTGQRLPQRNSQHSRGSLSETVLRASNGTNTSHSDQNRDSSNPNPKLTQMTPIIVIAEQWPTNYVQDVPLPKVQVPQNPGNRLSSPKETGPTIPQRRKSLLPGTTNLSTDGISFAANSQRPSAPTEQPSYILPPTSPPSPSPLIFQLIEDLELRLDARFTEIEAALFRLQNGRSVGVSRQTSSGGSKLVPGGIGVCCNGNGNGNANGKRFNGGGGSWERERFEKVQEKLESMIESMNGDEI